ncbi:linoleate 13S-lipoxygenase 2-1 [Pyrus ussuriensis x Pyrus communis]|uniref:Linoleate 13S-lipoxygenase 2-1 n=1 Tax=Pyrus ussuriensis x Pyrus communis TaxID=2448454 RepID=A0A5N5F0E7_9ROSA|nr:linoleate 13S-lipoxygenase 2-1 [Pyrus ussuriensis x Pyrus communis]
MHQTLLIAHLWEYLGSHLLRNTSIPYKNMREWQLRILQATAEHGLKLTIEDYPFANYGHILWDAIKEWVSDYVSHYYPDPNLIESDTELQGWWTEVEPKVMQTGKMNHGGLFENPGKSNSHFDYYHLGNRWSSCSSELWSVHKAKGNKPLEPRRVATTYPDHLSRR